MEQFPKRSTAYKFWIKDITNAVSISPQGRRMFEIRGKETLRVNIIAIVVDKQTNEEGTFSTITLDDGTDTIRVKTFSEDIKKLEETSIGDPVLVIGKVKMYGNEISITPEIVKKQEPEWLRVRKKELEQTYGRPEEKPAREEIKTEETVEETVEEPTETARQKILSLVEREISQEGIQVSKLIQKSGLKEEEAEKVIYELLREGEIFQPKTGFLKIV